jgi:hypothetical protein
MRNHDEKRRDICRSLLPSSARRAARTNKAILKRQHRRHIRHELHDWSRYDDVLNYEGFVHEDTNRPITGGVGWYIGQTMAGIVNERRDADNLGPFLNWVRATKGRLPGETDDDKFEALRRVLPDNLIGRHALGHAEYLFDLSGHHRWHYYSTPYDPEAEEKRYVAFVADVRALIETDHAYINDVFGGFDTCLGLHDVDRFALSVGRSDRARSFMERIIAGERPKIGSFTHYDPKFDRLSRYGRFA